jgi:3-isopropylmalate/(R)-2-methylmalate dehydratase small subunit
VELPGDVINGLFADFSGSETMAETDLEAGVFAFMSGGRRREIPFAVTEFNRALVAAGGWVAYADERY